MFLTQRHRSHSEWAFQYRLARPPARWKQVVGTCFLRQDTRRQERPEKKEAQVQVVWQRDVPGVDSPTVPPAFPPPKHGPIPPKCPTTIYMSAARSDFLSRWLAGFPASREAVVQASGGSWTIGRRSDGPGGPTHTTPKRKDTGVVVFV